MGNYRRFTIIVVLDYVYFLRSVFGLVVRSELPAHWRLSLWYDDSAGALECMCTAESVWVGRRARGKTGPGRESRAENLAATR